MRAAFSGFPEEALVFFRSLERNNRREWFQPRKQIYDRCVREPMVELVGAVNRELARHAPDYINEPGKAIYRLYRDTRFSSDKTPYKTHVAAIFPRRGLVKHCCASLYFSVSHKEIEIAGGVYMPQPEQLLAIRRHLAEHYQRFRVLERARKLGALLGKMQGDQLARVPKGFPSGHPAEDLIRRKQWLWFVTLDPSLATTPTLFGEVTSRFRVLVPALEFLNEPLLAERRKPAAESFLL